LKILVDADACPVKDIIVQETKEMNIPVTLVSSFSHFSSQEYPSHVNTVYVEAGPDAADFKIVQLAEFNDIIITQDYGLASLLLPKGCTVLHHKGFEYKPEVIDTMLQTRHLNAMARRSGERTKGPKPLSTEDKRKFTQLFKTILNTHT